MDQGREMFRRLRDMALGATAAKLGLPQAEAVIGAVIDLEISGNFATIVGFPTGEASVYLSSGGGFIGGFAHEAVRTAAKGFVAAAMKALPLLRLTRETPLPEPGMTTFYVLTPDGLHTAQAAESDLGNSRSPLSPLFYAGQEVISAYRLLDKPGS